MFSQRLATTILLEKSQQLNRKKLFLIERIQEILGKQFNTSTTSSRSIPRPPRTGGTDTKGAGDRR
ncbi:hypothetical protein WA1_47685 [Scytonema hofmannii PCC 7110]|jgi:hypothetical protein|uniref:Uncharacterized protein n=1 Tax=Scytonema hofmannii PCC 7110 TaxID=128403 RepID=A0A139WXY7_9CYAN|nr:hypothetical protein [Scytonema hofmannii]KYC37304.1 hypothetical protein WA1_47685 [Scytonema hofmannii PCC 7110]